MQLKSNFLNNQLVIVIIIGFFFIISCDNKKTLNNSKNIDSLLIKVNQNLIYKDTAAALILLNKIILIDSSIGEVYYKIGECYSEFGNYEKARNNFFKSISLKYNISKSYFRIALDYGILREHEMALKFYNKALLYDTSNIIIKQQIILTEEILLINNQHYEH